MSENDTGELYSLFAACPKYVEDLAEAELQQLGATALKRTVAGVSFRGDLVTAYRVCYGARVISRVFLVLAEFEAETEKEIYNHCRAVPWQEHLDVETSFAVDATAKNTFARNCSYLALVVKDAVADTFRELSGRRPSVDTQAPQLRLHIHLQQNRGTLSLDLSGESLHRRGYRVATVPASLKENAAAALLLRAGWPQIAAAGGSFVDPMCGSGTLLIEAALLAARIPTGKFRKHFGFLHWKHHRAEVWQAVVAEAESQSSTEGIGSICGYDHSREAIAASWENIRHAGLEALIHVEKQELSQAEPPPAAQSGGLVALNPPYGVRLGEEEELRELYRQLGSRLISAFAGWKGAVLTASRELSLAIGLRAERTNRLCNGPLECLLTHFDLQAAQVFQVYAPGAWQGEIDEALVNRLKKNLRHLGKWARRQELSCYRLYDADLPEYAVAIDYFEGTYLHIQEYAPPASVDPKVAGRRLKQVTAAARQLLGVAEEHIYLKQRKHQRGTSQYTRQAETGIFRTIHEGAWQFKVNFSDYLDPGVFLLTRNLRQLVSRLSQGKSFLNLFAYTGTATVAAAAGGARETVSVDTSYTYLEWAKDNLELNHLEGPNHVFYRADCLQWLEHNRQHFDLIFLDPPTYSNSKSREQDFDLQKQHIALIRLCLQQLTPGGILIFANNFKRFKLDAEALQDCRVTDLSRSTLPEDFSRKPGMYNCWQIEPTASGGTIPPAGEVGRITEKHR